MTENRIDDHARDQDPGGKQSAPSPARPRSILHGILLMVTLAIAGGGLHLAYRNRDAGISTRATLEDLLGSREALASRIGELEMQVAGLRGQQEATSRSVQDLLRELPGGNEDWALREVEFLLIISMHALALAHDMDAALGGMQAADLRLRGLGNAELDPVRAQVASDIQRLQQANAVDTQGLARALQELAGKVEHLPLAGAAGGGEDPMEKDGPAPDGHTGILAALWRELRSLVVIRRGAEGQRVLLAPGQEYFLYQNLRLELASARLALQRRDTDNLHASVAALRQWLQEYFAAGDPAVVNIMDTLEQLSSLDLQPPVPDISSSLEGLRAYMRAKAEPPPQDEGGNKAPQA